MGKVDLDALDWNDDEEFAKAIEQDPEAWQRWASDHSAVFYSGPPMVEAAAGLRFPFGIGGGIPEIDIVVAEDPPQLAERLRDGLPACGLLGAYNPEEYRITLWQRGIEVAASQLACDEKHLTHVVRVHELCHAMVHMGTPRAEPQGSLLSSQQIQDMARESAVSRSWSPQTRESVAQVLTAYALDETVAQCRSERSRRWAEDIRLVFGKLMPRQPPEYQVDSYLKRDRGRFDEILRFMRAGDVCGRYDVWRALMLS